MLYNKYEGRDKLMKRKYTVREIADIFSVSGTAVRNWIKAGLPHDTEKVIGLRRRIVIDPDDVYEFLGLDKKQ